MANPILSISELAMHFPTRAGLVRAVDGVSLDIEPGETVGLVGESGCGKSTLGKTAMRLTRPTAGSIRLEGKEIADLSRGALRPLRPKLQMIFQDPYASLNPRLTVGRTLEEPLVVHGRGNAAERRERVRWLADKVGLRPEALQRHPHEFSGGQRQRIGIARALALEPKLVICDEPVSALDVSVRAQVINLLMDLKRDFGLAYLFISHDLSVVRYFADRVLVMYLGRIVESASHATLWRDPRHPYTKALFAAVPSTDPTHKRGAPPIKGELTTDLSSGCRFCSRCPAATDRCRSEEPLLRSVGEGHHAACHFA